MDKPLMDISQLMTQFSESRGWDQQYRLIIQLGKKLPALDEEDKIEANQIKGCESLAWLILERQGDSYHFKMSSDTRVVSGLMMILLVIFEGKTAQQIACVDIHAIFTQLGLLNHLSPSRASGLLAIVDKIKSISCVEE